MVLNAEIMKPFNKWLTLNKRFKIAFGGRGGAKSETIARLAILKSFTFSNTFIVFAREVQKNITYSAYPLLIDIIRKLKLNNYFDITKNTITNNYSNVVFLFLGLHDYNIEETIKSIYNAKLVVIDEAQSLTQKTYEILEPSIRAKNSELWCSFNPMRREDAIYNLIVDIKDYKKLEYVYKSKKYYYNEFIDDRFLVTNINYDGNCYFPDTLEESRLLCIEKTPERYNHIWLGALDTAGGKIFQSSKLNTYNIKELSILDSLPLRCIIDPAFGDSSCFSAVTLYKINNGNIYLIDAGLIRGSINETSDEAIINFLLKHDVKQILCESNFSQSQLVKKLERYFKNVKGFQSTQKKLMRIVDNAITIKEKIYFPYEWFEPPKIPVAEYSNGWQGRGYLCIQQLLNFSDIAKDNNIQGDDTSYIDAPDNLSNLVMFDRDYDIASKSIINTQIVHTNVRNGWRKVY